MYILYGSIELFLPHCASLKEKRKVLNSLIDKTRKRFNISISETGYQDLWQRSIIGFSAVGSNYGEIEKFISYLQDTLDNYLPSIEIISLDYDIIHQDFSH